MRQLRGKKVLELSAADWAALRARHDRVVVDLGTGDGKHAYQLARREPQTLVVGLDAAKDNLRKVSARTDAKNLIYLWCPVEQLPPELTELDELHVLMPWGSLLRGILGDPPSLLAELAGRCRPGARFLITLNLHAWNPPVPEVGRHPEPTPDSTDLPEIYAASDWHIDRAWYLDEAGVAELATSWTRRLNSSRERLDVLALTGTIGGDGTGSGPAGSDPGRDQDDSDSTKS